MNVYFGDISYKKYEQHVMMIFLIFLFIGLSIGYYMPHSISVPVVKSVVTDSASAKLMDVADDNGPLKVVLFFVNNITVAILLMILPMIYSSCILMITGEKKNGNFRIEPIWISRFAIIMQALPIGIVIGYGTGIINNNLIVITSLLPHGIIEVCALLIAATLGLWFAMEQSVKDVLGYRGIGMIFIKIVVPAIFVAAIIETYVTPYLVTLVS